MDGENVKVRDRIELALDGRQIASVVVGALVLLGVVFVLGLNVGKQTAVKQLEASRADGLAALDQPPPAPPVPSSSLTFHSTLTKDPNAPPEPGPSVQPSEPKAAEARPPPRPEAAAEPKVAAKPSAKPEPKLEAKPEPKVARAEGGKAAYVVQVVATPSRAEADRLAGKLKDYAPRVEETDVPGKGRLYRVRVGGFGTKPEAEKFLKAFNSKTGSKGLVVASR
jgi:cell division septation protein DedD